MDSTSKTGGWKKSRASSQEPQMICFHWKGFKCLYFLVDSEQHVYVCRYAWEYTCVYVYLYMRVRNISQSLSLCDCITLLMWVYLYEHLCHGMSVAVLEQPAGVNSLFPEIELRLNRLAIARRLLGLVRVKQHGFYCCCDLCGGHANMCRGQRPTLSGIS